MAGKNASLPDALRDIVGSHVASFDYFAEHGLADVVAGLSSVTLQIPGTTAESSRILVWFEKIYLGKPCTENGGLPCTRDPRVFPRECREASTTYKAPMTASICWSAEEGKVHRRNLRICMFPGMVRSVACHLAHATSADLVSRGEECNEMGGYFILNGNERIIRLLVQQRRHYIMYAYIIQIFCYIF